MEKETVSYQQSDIMSSKDSRLYILLTKSYRSGTELFQQHQKTANNKNSDN
jgi:hypothetical protein